MRELDGKAVYTSNTARFYGYIPLAYEYSRNTNLMNTVQDPSTGFVL